MTSFGFRLRLLGGHPSTWISTPFGYWRIILTMRGLALSCIRRKYKAHKIPHILSNILLCTYQRYSFQRNAFPYHHSSTTKLYPKRKITLDHSPGLFHTLGQSLGEYLVKRDSFLKRTYRTSICITLSKFQTLPSMNYIQ